MASARATVALGLACLVHSCSSLPQGTDELSLLQVPEAVPSREDFENAKKLVEKYEHASSVAKSETAHQMEVIKEQKQSLQLDKLAKQKKNKEDEEARAVDVNDRAKRMHAKAVALKAKADAAAAVAARTTRCPTTFTTTTMTSTFKPLSGSAWVAYTSANVTGPDEAYDQSFDPLLDDQRGFTLDLFIGNFPDQTSEPKYKGTVIASKFQQDPNRARGTMGWALLYHKKGIENFGVYNHPYLEFVISNGGRVHSTRQYLLRTDLFPTQRVTVSYNGPHYKRVRIYVNQEERVEPQEEFPDAWRASVSPSDLDEAMIPATRACFSVAKISPDPDDAPGTVQNLPDWSGPFQGDVGGITFYHGQVTMAHMRNYYAPEAAA